MKHSIGKLVVLALLIGLTWFPAGCDGSGGTTTTTSSEQGGAAGGEEVAGGAANGFLFLQAGSPRGLGAFLIGSQAGPPPGYVPAMDETLQVAGRMTRTGPDGFFQLDGLPSGHHELQMGSETLLLTVLFDATLRLADPPITREQAADRVETALTDQGVDLSRTFLMGPQQALPPGVTVTIATGADDPEAPPPLVLERLSWFFYADLAADAGFGHDTRFGLVDAVTGEVQLFERGSWPVLNGTEFYRSADENLDGPDTVRAATRPPSFSSEEAGRVSASVLLQGEGDEACPTSNVHAVLVRSTTEPDFELDVVNVRQALIDRFGAQPGNITTIRLQGEDTLDQDPTAIYQPAIRQAYARMNPCDTFVLYVTAHATRQSAKDPERTTVEMGRRKSTRFVIPGTPPVIGTKVEVTSNTRNWESFLLSECPACNIIVIADVCFSETFVDGNPRFSGGKGPLARNLRFIADEDLPGRRVLLLASAARNQTSKSYEPKFLISVASFLPGNEILGAGGVYTNHLLRALGQTADGDPVEAFRLAHGAVSIGQAPPPAYLKTPAAEERTECLGGTEPPPPPPDPPPFSVSVDTDLDALGEQLLVEFAHTQGTDPCPLALAPIFVENKGSAPIELTITGGNFLTVDPVGGPITVEPGVIRVINVSYACGANASFDSTVRVAASGSGNSITRDVIYRGAITVPTCVTRAVIRNNGPGFFFAGFGSKNVSFSKIVLISEGTEYVETRDQAIEGLDVRLEGSGLQGFDLDVPCGFQGVFTRLGTEFTPSLEPIP